MSKKKKHIKQEELEHVTGGGGADRVKPTSQEDKKISEEVQNELSFYPEPSPTGSKENYNI
jgi:hypothetical protein